MAKRWRRGQGEGSGHKRPDGRYVWTVELPRRDGRRRRRSFYGHTEAEARAKRDAFTAGLRDGFEQPTGKTPTVTQWCGRWLQDMCTAGPSSRAVYAGVIRTHITPAIGRVRLADLTEDAVAGLYRALPPATVRKVHAVLSQALTAAVARRVIPRSPAQFARVPAARPAPVTPPTYAEVRRVMGAVAGRRDGARWLTAVALGLRQGEVLGLMWPLLDLDRGTVGVSWQLKRRPMTHGCGDPGRCGGPGRSCPRRLGGLVLCPPKSAGSADVLPLPPPLVSALRAHRARQAAERLAAGAAWAGWAHDCSRRLRPREPVCPVCLRPADPAALVFTGPRGGPVDLHTDWQHWRDLCATLGLPAYRLHDLRHFTATFLLELGVDIAVVQAVLRHSDIRMTRSYQHVSVGLTAGALARAGEKLWQGLGQ